MRRELYKLFFAFVIPSVLSFALSGVYAIVDGFFVGNSIGDIGLSAINIAYPVVSLMQALGTGIGMGGSVLYSIREACGDKSAASRYARSIFTLLILVSILFTAAAYLLREPVLLLLGAEGDLVFLGLEYLRVMILGCTFQIFSTGVVPLIRNLGGSVFSMISMMTGFLTNILLDYVMIWKWELGMTGAALATIIGQALTMLIGIGYILVRKKELIGVQVKGLGNTAVQIAKVGVAPFGLTMSPILSLIVMNRYSIKYGGEPAIACYACISYVTSIVYMLMQGVGDGCQPLISRYYGLGETKHWRFIRKLAYVTSFGLAVISVAILYASKSEIGLLFGASGTANNLIASSMWIFLLGFFFLSYTRVTTAGFYATEQALYSYVLVYAEPVLLTILLLLMPRVLGLDGVWWSICVAQILCAGISLLLDQKVKRII